MAGSLDEWARYERWNAAIADVVYSPSRAGVPVYLDLEDDILDDIRERAEPEAGDSAAALVDAVMGILVLRDGASPVLRGLEYRLDRWYNGSMLEPPPTLAFLAMLSLVAENMRQSTEMRAHNFYGRLAELAGLTDIQLHWFEDAYRHRINNRAASAELWESLNDWLEMMEGSRGLPTAIALGHEHVGLPLSQALVRQADRAKFSDLFSTQGLPAGSSFATSEMEAQIDEWMARNPCPASNTLERLWKEQPAARAPIAEVARLALESWDGLDSNGLPSSGGQRGIDLVKLKAMVLTFPSGHLDLSLVIPGRAEWDVEQVDVIDADDNVIDCVELVPVASGWMGIGADTGVDAASVLDGQIRLRRAKNGQLLQRRPRRLITLRWDELLRAFVECERVQLGEEALVLTRVEIAPKVIEFLERTARPGFQQRPEMPGLPHGWVLLDSVQIMGVLPKDGQQLVDLGVLQPLTRSQVVLQGGLKLPGHLPKWLSSRPPELRVSSEDSSEIVAKLACIRPLTKPTPPDVSRSTTGSVLIWDLSDTNIPDGDYRIQVESEGEVIGSELLRLRSADSPALAVTPAEMPIAHDPHRQCFGLFAGRSSSELAFTGCPYVSGVLVENDPPSVPGWWRARATPNPIRSSIRIVRFPTGGPTCAKTGGHFIDLPMGLEGQSSIEGVCRHCGLVKRYPTKYRPKKKQRAGPTAPVLSVRDLPRVRVERDIDWDVAFNAVCHVGEGAMSALERITAQMEATDLFGDSFARKLDLLGHIEIERSSISLAGISWKVNPPLLIGLPSGEVCVLGFRNDEIMVAIEDHVWANGGEFEVKPSTSAPAILKIKGINDAGVQKIAELLGEVTGRPARFVPEAAVALAAQLPPLSRARNGLPGTSTLAADSYESWDPVRAQFGPATDVGAAGGFRISGYGRAYVYRRSEDLGTMQATLADARIVKYLAALDSGLSLVGYDAEAKILYVPLGADLPGLYGRAAVLASGRPPVENLDERILEYREVPPRLAGHLAHLLMS